MYIRMVNMEALLEIPEGVAVSVSALLINVSGPKGEVGIPFSKKTIVKMQDKSLSISAPKPLLNTTASHVKNAFKGVVEGHRKHLKILHSHFPMKLEVRDREVHIKNFLGGKVDLVAKIVGSSKVKINGKDIEVEGPSLYGVGQTAANLETATKVRGRDERIFQDGIYVVE